MVMNTKGASASGKSTMRPLQRRLAAELGVDMERFRRRQPGHLAQVPARLRRARRRVQVRRRVHRPRAGDRRPEARPLHGAQGRARRHDPPADRPLPLRQLRARLRPGGQQPAHALRPRGLHVLHDHAAARDGRARVAARPGGRALQGGRRHARAQRRGLRRHAGAVLHLGAARRHVGALRVPRQQRAVRRAPAHGRVRTGRRAQRPRREVPARRRPVPEDRHRRLAPGGGLSWRRSDGRGEQRAVPRASAYAGSRR